MINYTDVTRELTTVFDISMLLKIDSILHIWNSRVDILTILDEDGLFSVVAFFCSDIKLNDFICAPLSMLKQFIQKQNMFNIFREFDRG